MRVRVNGREVGVADPASVDDVARLVGVAPGETGVAVALDGEVVPRARWSETGLREGAVLEIVRAAAGG